MCTFKSKDSAVRFRMLKITDKKDQFIVIRTQKKLVEGFEKTSLCC